VVGACGHLNVTIAITIAIVVASFTGIVGNGIVVVVAVTRIVIYIAIVVDMLVSGWQRIDCIFGSYRSLTTLVGRILWRMTRHYGIHGVLI